MHNMRHLFKIILCLSFTGLWLLTSGCWDRVEIEQRGFVVGTAFDLVGQTKNQNSPLYQLTHQIIIPAGYGGSSAKGSKSSASKAYHNVTATGETLFASARELAAKMSRTPFLEDNQLFIVSEKLAKAGYLPDVLDLYMRDPESRRSSKVMVARDNAGKILALQSPSEKYPVAYINSVSENAFKNFRIYPPVEMGRLQQSLLYGHSFVLPEIKEVNPQTVKVTGTAVFNGQKDKLVGFLNENETKGLRLLRGNAEDGLIQIQLKGKWMVIEIKNVKRRLKVDFTSSGLPIFTFFIQAKGNLGESHLHQDRQELKHIPEMERKTEERIEQLARETIQTSQKKFKTDTLGLADFMRRNHFSKWKKMRDNWDRGENLFADCTIRVKAKVKLIEVGVVNKTSR